MKKLLYLSVIFIALVSCPTSYINAQGVGINPSGNAPNASAGLDVDFTTKGMLMPRLNNAQRDAITNPTKGLTIYNTTTDCFNYFNGTLWYSMCGNCIPPATPAVSSNSPVCTGSSLNLSASSLAGVSYSWTGPNGFNSTLQNPIISNITSAGSGTYNVIASISGCNSNIGSISVVVNTLPSSPSAATNSLSQTQITWNWNTVSGALGYKYSTVNNYGAAIDNGTGTTYTQSGLTCNTSYSLYVWAYNNCGNSIVTTLMQSTSACPWTCGSALVINHIAGSVAPETKTVSYGTIMTNLSGASKCWITQNLGANNQATSATDATDAAAGWYWQFNLKQGYKPGPTPAWTVSSINENSNWISANDPCTIELGTGWRLPTDIELSNVISNGGWSDYNVAFNSVLKLHAGGYLNYPNGVLTNRGVTGYARSSIQSDASNAYYVYNGSTTTNISNSFKAYGFTLRCVKD